MIEDTITLYCENHPNVQTTLRCNRCDKPICARCAVRTPTGYRCRQCVSGQLRTFDTAQWFDYPLAFIVAAVLSYLGSQIVSYLGFFTLFLSPVAGVIIAEVVRAILRRRRSRRLFTVTAVGAALGSLPLVFLIVITWVLSLTTGFSNLSGILFPLLWQGIYTFTVTTTVYYRLSGIQIRA